MELMMRLEYLLVSLKTADMMTFRELGEHCYAAGHGLLGMMLSGVDDFTTPDFRERLKEFIPPLAPECSQTDLAAALRQGMEQRVEELAKQPADFFDAIMTRFDGQRVTRMEMVQMVKEHEMTHRSQMFVYLRMQGIVPSTTRQRQARQSAK
jgi:hypothetical protein